MISSQIVWNALQSPQSGWQSKSQLSAIHSQGCTANLLMLVLVARSGHCVFTAHHIYRKPDNVQASQHFIIKSALLADSVQFLAKINKLK